MPLQIPGYYFDAAKNKYFKIERSQTAPSTAQWSATSVKRRQTEASAALAVRKRQQLLRHCIRRSALHSDPLAGGMLERECGAGGGGRRRMLDVGELRAAAWAGGCVGRGGAEWPRGGFNMPCFLVAGEGDHTEVGVAYTTIDEWRLYGTYLEADEHGRIGGRVQEAKTMHRLGVPTAPLETEMVRCPQMSSIAYHEPSHQVILTSRDPEQNCGLFMFSPPISTTIDDRRHWLIGQAVRYQHVAVRPNKQPHNIIHKCTPAPSSSPLLCLIGTNAGLLSVDSNGSATSSINTTPNPSFPSSSPKHVRGTGEIFDQAFSPANHNVAYIGGRAPRFWVADLRTSSLEWDPIRTQSSVAHIRCVKEHQVLTVGLRNSMALWDVRFLSRSRPWTNRATAKAKNEFEPLLKFPEYRNAAHVHTGFDLSTDLGLVAAAHDDGTVKLFCLRSGRMFPGASNALGAVKMDAPVKALQFKRLPGEGLPSLFVAEGTTLRKYSFWSDGDD